MIFNILLIISGLSIFNIILLIYSCNKDVKTSDVNKINLTNNFKQLPNFTTKKIKSKQVPNLPKENQLAATGS